MNGKLNSLLEYVKSDGRVCPMHTFWNELWQMLPDRKHKISGWEPSLPLILGAWWATSAREKMDRLKIHILYADTQGVLDKVESYLRNLKPDQWAYGDGTTEWKEYNVKNINRTYK